jgi:hypothetical protein
MGPNRAFFPQDLLDRWLAEELVSLEGDVLGILPDGPLFQLSSGVLLRADVGVGDDAPGLTGKVKSLAQLEAIGGDHAPGSVVLGDHAYEVCDGFLAQLVARPEQTDAGSHALQALLALRGR